MDILEPIVIDPPGFDIKAAWGDCKERFDKYTAAERPEAAAAYADPGICSCPSCHQDHWAWGHVQRCGRCGFEFPVDAWAKYSWGVQDARWLAGKRGPNAEFNKSHVATIRRNLAQNRKHPYYAYGFDHPQDDDLFEFFEKTDFKPLVGSMRAYLHNDS